METVYSIIHFWQQAFIYMSKLLNFAPSILGMGIVRISVSWYIAILLLPTTIYYVAIWNTLVIGKPLYICEKVGFTS